MAMDDGAILFHSRCFRLSLWLSRTFSEAKHCSWFEVIESTGDRGPRNISPVRRGCPDLGSSRSVSPCADESGHEPVGTFLNDRSAISAWGGDSHFTTRARRSAQNFKNNIAAVATTATTSGSGGARKVWQSTKQSEAFYLKENK